MKKLAVLFVCILATLSFAACEEALGAVPTSVTVKTPPTKTEYVMGSDETLDLSGGVLTVTYSNGTQKDVPMTDITVTFTGFSLDVAGPVSIELKYGILTVAIEITVVPGAPTDAELLRSYIAQFPQLKFDDESTINAVQKKAIDDAYALYLQMEAANAFGDITDAEKKTVKIAAFYAACHEGVNLIDALVNEATGIASYAALTAFVANVDYSDIEEIVAFLNSYDDAFVVDESIPLTAGVAAEYIETELADIKAYVDGVVAPAANVLAGVFGLTAADVPNSSIPQNIAEAIEASYAAYEAIVDDEDLNEEAILAYVIELYPIYADIVLEYYYITEGVAADAFTTLYKSGSQYIIIDAFEDLVGKMDEYLDALDDEMFILYYITSASAFDSIYMSAEYAYTLGMVSAIYDASGTNYADKFEAVYPFDPNNSPLLTTYMLYLQMLEKDTLSDDYVQNGASEEFLTDMEMFLFFYYNMLGDVAGIAEFDIVADKAVDYLDAFMNVTLDAENYGYYQLALAARVELVLVYQGGDDAAFVAAFETFLAAIDGKTVNEYVELERQLMQADYDYSIVYDDIVNIIFLYVDACILSDEAYAAYQNQQRYNYSNLIISFLAAEEANNAFTAQYGDDAGKMYWYSALGYGQMSIADLRAYVLYDYNIVNTYVSTEFIELYVVAAIAYADFLAGNIVEASFIAAVAPMYNAFLTLGDEGLEAYYFFCTSSAQPTVAIEKILAAYFEKELFDERADLLALGDQFLTAYFYYFVATQLNPAYELDFLLNSYSFITAYEALNADDKALFGEALYNIIDSAFDAHNTYDLAAYEAAEYVIALQDGFYLAYSYGELMPFISAYNLLYAYMANTDGADVFVAMLMEEGELADYDAIYADLFDWAELGIIEAEMVELKAFADTYAGVLAAIINEYIAGTLNIYNYQMQILVMATEIQAMSMAQQDWIVNGMAYLSYYFAQIELAELYYEDAELSVANQMIEIEPLYISYALAAEAIDADGGDALENPYTLDFCVAMDELKLAYEAITTPSVDFADSIFDLRIKEMLAYYDAMQSDVPPDEIFNLAYLMQLVVDEYEYTYTEDSDLDHTFYLGAYYKLISYAAELVAENDTDIIGLYESYTIDISLAGNGIFQGYNRYSSTAKYFVENAALAMHTDIMGWFASGLYSSGAEFEAFINAYMAFAASFMFDGEEFANYPEAEVVELIALQRALGINPRVHTINLIAASYHNLLRMYFQDKLEIDEYNVLDWLLDSDYLSAIRRLDTSYASTFRNYVAYSYGYYMALEAASKTKFDSYFGVLFDSIVTEANSLYIAEWSTRLAAIGNFLLSALNAEDDAMFLYYFGIAQIMIPDLNEIEQTSFDSRAFLLDGSTLKDLYDECVAYEASLDDGEGGEGEGELAA